MLEITGYADRFSVRPGETIEFKVSCEGPIRYRADIVRIVNADTNPKGPGFKEEQINTAVSRDYPGRHQRTYAGSYVRIPDDQALASLASWRVEALIWPTTPTKGEQVILGKWSPERAGFLLMIDAAGCLALRLGSGGGGRAVTTGSALIAREWYRIEASFDAASGIARVAQHPLSCHPGLEHEGTASAHIDFMPQLSNAAPLLIAAQLNSVDGERLDVGACFNGKIEAPRIATGADGAKPVAAWDFAREISTTRVIDVGPNALHGETVNLPTRAMKGHNWSGAELCWTRAPEQYAAIHFHDDDLYDAGWSTDFALTIPAELRSGFYAAKLSANSAEDYVPFFVVPPKGEAHAPLALLVPTASYMAYGNDHSMLYSADAELGMGRVIVLNPADIFLGQHPEFGRSMYDVHPDGSGVAFSSRLRPLLNQRPKYQSFQGGLGSGLWQYPADTHIVDWLEATGQSYDVISDEELHAEGVELLQRYRAVMTGTHPEYYSLAMLDALQSYVDHGGRLIYLGANGFYWRVEYHPEIPGVIELRRGEGGCRTWIAEGGEYYHAFSGAYGGLWQRQGRPPQALVGVGFSAEGFDYSSYYRRLPDSFQPRVAFIFDGVGDDERIGDFGLIGGGAAGLEIDRADRALGTPPHALVLASSEGHTDNYLMVPEDLYCMRLNITASTNPLVRADMVFFEAPNGGAVFSTGSIAWAGSLSHNNYDNNVARITGNVVRRFLDPKPF